MLAEFPESNWEQFKMDIFILTELWSCFAYYIKEVLFV